jgi:hypothetical protein
MDEFDADEVYTIRVDEIIDNKKLLPITRRLAKKIASHGYITVGEFILVMEDEELEHLIEFIPSANEEAPESYDSVSSELMLLSELLALGEGLPSANVADIITRTSFFAKLLIFESLYRKGIINAFHENWTLDLDINNDSILVECIPGITPTADEIKRLMGPKADGQ